MCCTGPCKQPPASIVENRLKIELSEHGVPSIIVNGVEIAGAIEPNWRLDNIGEPGLRQAKLTVTYPVSLP